MTTAPLRAARAIADKAEAAPLEVYREILGRWDSIESGDAERLAQSLTALGITDADVYADLAELTAVRTLEARADAARADMDSMPNVAALEAQVERFDRVLAHEFDRMLDGKRDLLKTLERRREAEATLRQASERLAERKRRAPRLFKG